jgi:hypothetical protein
MGRANRRPRPARAVTREPDRPRWFLPLAAGILVGAAVLRVWGIGAQEFWLDEAFSFYMVTTPHFAGNLLTDNTPPLYYLLLRPWSMLAGESEAGLRLLSAALGVAFVGVVIGLGRELFDRRVGLLAGLAAALSPIHVYYSQEARVYALLALLLALTYGALWRAFATNEWRWWGAASALSLCALYSHYLAALALLPTALLLIVGRDRSRWTRYLGAMAASGLLFAPWLVVRFGLTAKSETGVSWIKAAWEQTPPLLAIPLSLEVFALGGQAGQLPVDLKQVAVLQFPAALRWLGVAALLVLGGTLVATARGVPGARGRAAWLAGLLLAPLVVLWAISFVTPAYVVGRYDQIAFAAFPLLVGVALAELARAKRVGRTLAVLVGLALFVPAGAKLLLYHQATTPGHARATARALDHAVVFTGIRGLPVIYQLSRLGYAWAAPSCRNGATGRHFACRLYPREYEHPTTPQYDTRRVLASRTEVRADLDDVLASRASPSGAVWLVFGEGSLSDGRLRLPAADDALIREMLAAGFQGRPLAGPLGIFRFARP